jgi:MinD superfamily P-loop ATPase
MKQLVVLSGKGGTGKTTLTAALADLASAEMAVVLADADVDAANLELVLQVERVEEHEFRSGQVAVIDPEICTACGACYVTCRFDAITVSGARGPSDASSRSGTTDTQVRRGSWGDRAGVYTVDPVACEGCAACFYQCSDEAIWMKEQVAGKWYRSDTPFGPLFHAHLMAGRENSGKLVTLLKQKARSLAEDSGASLVIIDGPPGIGCPVISATTGMDAALLVTEPSLSGLHDLERILSTTEHFGVEAFVVINKADLNAMRTQEIREFCKNRRTEVLGDIPFDSVVTEALVDGRPVTVYSDGQVSQAIKAVWASLALRLGG